VHHCQHLWRGSQDGFGWWQKDMLRQLLVERSLQQLPLLLSPWCRKMLSIYYVVLHTWWFSEHT
jgi:hypothetical protein